MQEELKFENAWAEGQEPVESWHADLPEALILAKLLGIRLKVVVPALMYTRWTSNPNAFWSIFGQRQMPDLSTHFANFEERYKFHEEDAFGRGNRLHLARFIETLEKDTQIVSAVADQEPPTGSEKVPDEFHSFFWIMRGEATKRGLMQCKDVQYYFTVPLDNIAIIDIVLTSSIVLLKVEPEQLENMHYSLAKNRRWALKDYVSGRTATVDGKVLRAAIWEKLDQTCASYRSADREDIHDLDLVWDQ